MEANDVCRAEILAAFLGLDKDEVQQGRRRSDDAYFEVASRQYLVLDDDEAEERARDYIRQSLWAFRPEFLSSYTPRGVGTDVLRLLQEKCEDSNDALLALVGDRFDDLASDAIGADGRGHFLATYDGNEGERGGFYIYRTN